MPDAPSRFSAFADLDASTGLAASVAWLERVAALAPVRAGKQRSYELLNLGPGDRVLDVGCGTGADALALARIVAPGGEVVGVDASAGVLAAARRAAAAAGCPARFELADAGALPFPDDAFDACRCDRTVQHLPDPSAAVNELARVTRPGGVVAVSESRNHVAESESRQASVLAEIFALDHPGREPGLWVGLMLPLALQQAGVTEVRIESLQGRLADADQITSFFDLQRVLERAVAERRLTASRAQELHAGIVAESAAGRLSVVVETHIFFGRVAPG